MGPLLALSANFDHPDPERALYKGKRLAYVESSMLSYLRNGGARPILIPPNTTLEEYGLPFDGLVLTGGSDVAPQSYGEDGILQNRWPGDPFRDGYEQALLQEAHGLRIPTLGICRGAQMLNVAMGGSLYQDISQQQEGTLHHRDWDIYDLHHHPANFSGWLADVLGADSGLINSIHHQAVKRVAPGFEVVAEAEDGVIEAIRWTGDDWFALGVQWHPEMPLALDGAVSSEKLLDAFFASMDG